MSYLIIHIPPKTCDLEVKVTPVPGDVDYMAALDKAAADWPHGTRLIVCKELETWTVGLVRDPWGGGKDG
jgi:hypothetical protein